MAENLLNRVLNGEIELEILWKWLKSSIDEEFEICKGGCTRGEFISFFLNYIHEEAPCFDKYCDTPQKVHTPKSIRKVDLTPNVLKIKRRPALFSETKKNDCQTTLDDELKSRLSPNTSTPKCSRLSTNKSLLNELNGSQDVSYTSPVSPIYTRLNLTTPKSRTRASTNICLGDYLTQSHKKSGKKKIQKNENVEPQEFKKSRRINPTNLNQKRFTFNRTNSYNFCNDNKEIVAENVDEQRSLLVEERLKIATRMDEPIKINKIVPKSQKNEILPDLKRATYRKHLDRIADVYLYFLRNNFVLNLTSELYFVISLVLRKQYEDVIDLNDLSMEDADEYVPSNKVFNTIHNTIYFAVKILENQLNILRLLEKSCLKLLGSNERLKELSPDLCNKLLEVCAENEVKQPENLTDGDFHVCFMSDTDNRENFPSDASFHAFRKQRDLFYEILRIWEEHHVSEGWNFSMALGGKIKSLLHLYNDATNFRHLSRLFKSLLLATCGKVHVEPLAENQLSFLSSFPNINSEKLSRLKSRLVTKTTSNGINALPTFTGQQEFYKEFIVAASMHTFNVHLKDAFIHEILQLNESKFSCNELEEKGTHVDLETRRLYQICLKSLRLLAKFLGFVESLPYKKQNFTANDKVTSVEIQMRQWEQPPFDVKLLLTNAVTNGTLILTIPWLTKFLAMLDHTTLRLSYYQAIYNVLFNIFYSARSSMLVRLCLGWLFELPHFPSELYFIWCTKYAKDECVDTIGTNDSLDRLDIVDRCVIYLCCPYMNEFKKLLQYNCTKNGTITVKHITPVTAVEFPVQVNEKRLKLQLEDAFLNAQPISMRKTVEFVSERVASACVKCICNKLVPEEKSKALPVFQKFLQSTSKDQDVGVKKFKMELKMKCGEFVQDRLANLKLQCMEELEKQTIGKIPECIRLLLSEEELQQTVDACTAIAKRMCKDRVQQWVNSHIISGIYSKDFDAEVVQIFENFPKKEAKAKSVFVLPTFGRNVDHNPDVGSAVSIVENIRAISIKALECSSDLSRKEIVDLIDDTEKGFISRCDINDCIGLLINRLLLDLIVILIANWTKMCDQELMLRFVAFWKIKLDVDIFKNIVCPRNVKILNRSPKRSDAWDKLSDLFGILLKEETLDFNDFEAQCVAIYQQDWDNVTLKHFSMCFQGVVDAYSKHSKGDPKFTYLLSFLSDFCSDMEF